MSSLTLAGVSFAYDPAHPLFQDLSLSLWTGWTGLVGANGTGKSTLLRLLAGELSPEGGSIQQHPPGGALVLCPQRVEHCEPAIKDFAARTDREAQRRKAQLALSPQDLDRWPTLSPGERKRWQLGAALSASPAVLLLDEPTNHLDTHGLQLVHEALAHFDGVGIIVSHDRALLQALCAYTLRLQAGAATLYVGGYDEARAQWEAEARARVEERARRQSEEDKQRRALDRKRRQQEAVERARSSSARMKGPKDHDARGALAKMKIAAAARSLSREVGVARARVERAEEARRALVLEKEKGRALSFLEARAPTRWLLVAEGEALTAGGRQLVGPYSVALGRDDRVWLRGPNGAGKSTLLTHLLAQARIPRERLLYLPQELPAAEGLALLEEARRLRGAARARLCSLVAALGLDPETLLRSARPSPGEERKLCLAYGLAQQAWGLLLDEPTHHLDLPSIERLEDALRDYPGALLLVSHDERFARACCHESWELHQGTLRTARLSAS